MKVSGEKIASMTVRDAHVGSHTVAWNSEKATPGIYLVSIKHNGSTSGMKVYLR